MQKALFAALCLFGLTSCSTDDFQVGLADQTSSQSQNLVEDQIASYQETPSDTIADQKDPNKPTVKDGTPGEVVCLWNDDQHEGFIPGLPSSLKVPASYLKKHGYREGSNFVFEIRVLHDSYRVDDYGKAQLDNGQKKGRETHFRGVITNIDSSSCVIAATQNGTSQRFNNGCFEATSVIRMANGGEKLVMFLSSNDLVYNPVTQKPAKIKKLVSGWEAKPLYEIGYDKNIVKVTEEHPFRTSEGLRQAKELKVGDLILTESKEFVPLTVVRVMEETKNQLVYNLVLAGESNRFNDHAVLVNGVISGDLFIQQRLAEDINLVRQVTGFESFMERMAGFVNSLKKSLSI